MRFRCPNRSGEILVGSLHPVGGKRCVVLLHGFTAHHEYGIIKQLFSRLEESGATVAAFDFAGNGQSDGDFSKATFSKEVKDVRDVLNFLERMHGYEEFITVGHSMGGSVALLHASSDERVIGVVTLGAVADTQKQLRDHEDRFYPGASFDLARVDGVDLVEREMKITHEWLDDAAQTDVLANIPHRPCLVLHGSRDKRVHIEHARMLIDKGLHMVTLPTDHYFLDVADTVASKIEVFVGELPEE